MTSDEWKHRAYAEVHAIISADGIGQRSVAFDDLVTLMAIAWLQGVDLGCHETLADAERAFENLRAELQS